jgi:hypothetical protein
MRKVLRVGVPLLLLGASGCSLSGLFGPKGPETITFVFSNETVGELKPCG